MVAIRQFGDRDGCLIVDQWLEAEDRKVELSFEAAYGRLSHSRINWRKPDAKPIDSKNACEDFNDEIRFEIDQELDSKDERKDSKRLFRAIGLWLTDEHTFVIFGIGEKPVKVEGESEEDYKKREARFYINLCNEASNRLYSEEWQTNPAEYHHAIKTVEGPSAR